jgi:hypothetical protein
MKLDFMKKFSRFNFVLSQMGKKVYFYDKTIINYLHYASPHDT